MKVQNNPLGHEEDHATESWKNGITGHSDQGGVSWVGRRGTDDSRETERPGDRHGDRFTPENLRNRPARLGDDAEPESKKFVPHESVTQAVKEMMQLLPLDNLLAHFSPAKPLAPVEETATASGPKASVEKDIHVSIRAGEPGAESPADADDARVSHLTGPAVTESDDGSVGLSGAAYEGAARELSTSPMTAEEIAENRTTTMVGPKIVSERLQNPVEKPEEPALPEQATPEPPEPVGGKVAEKSRSESSDEGIEPLSAAPAAHPAEVTQAQAPHQQPGNQQSLQAMIPNGEVDVMVWPRQVSRGSMTERGAQEAERALQETSEESGSSRAP